MLALVSLSSVVDLTNVDRVGEDLVELAASERHTAELPTGDSGADWDADALFDQFLCKQADIADGAIAPEYIADQVGMLLDDRQGSPIGPIAQWRVTAHPHAFGLGGREVGAYLNYRVVLRLCIHMPASIAQNRALVGSAYAFRKMTDRLLAGISTTRSNASPCSFAHLTMASNSRKPQRASRACKSRSKASLINSSGMSERR